MLARLRPFIGCATAAAFLSSLPLTALAAPGDDGPPVQVAGAAGAGAAPSTPGAADPGEPSVREIPAADETPVADANVDVVGDPAGPSPSVVFGPPGAEPMDTLPPAHDRNRGLGMTVAGFTLFGAFYLISAGLGTMAIDGAFAWSGSAEDDWDAQRRETFGQRLTIPVAGPFLAVPYAGTATGGLATAMLGVVQVAGLTLGTVGAVRLGKSRREHRFAMGGTPTPDGGFGTVQVRF